MNMFSKLFCVISLLVALCVCGHAAEDQFVGMSPELAKFIAPYIDKAKATFPAVKKKYIAGDYVREKRVLDVQVDLIDKDGTKELSFVRVIQCLGNNFQGVVVNTMYYVKEFHMGDTVSFTQNQIKNWVVTDAEGKEEGNYVGKAIDAYLSKLVGVYFEVVYRKGKFELRYYDAEAPRSQNSVDGILPDEVIAKVAGRLKAGFEKKKREGQKFEEGKPFYSYGIYDIRTGEIEP